MHMPGYLALLLLFLAPVPSFLHASAPEEPLPDLVLKARKLMPPSLRSILEQREHLLLGGFRDGAVPDGREKQSEALSKELAGLVSQLRKEPSFDGIVERMGKIARLIQHNASLDLALRSRMGDRVGDDYSRYTQRKRRFFVAVFSGYSPALFGEKDAAGYLSQAAERTEKYAERVAACYREGGSGDTFDDLSPAFGVASLQYSHVISDIANLWLFAWREGGGDLSGTPYYGDTRLQTHDPGASDGKN